MHNLYNIIISYTEFSLQQQIHIGFRFPVPISDTKNNANSKTINISNALNVVAVDHADVIYQKTAI